MTMHISGKGEGKWNSRGKHTQKTKLVLIGTVIRFSLDKQSNLKGQCVDSVAER